MFTRTLSNHNRSDDDENAKEIFLSQKRNEITQMLTNGELTVTETHTIWIAINNYVKFNADQTRYGFERGLVTLINTQLSKLSEAMTQKTNSKQPV